LFDIDPYSLNARILTDFQRWDIFKEDKLILYEKENF